jgi:hypothetical protein
MKKTTTILAIAIASLMISCKAKEEVVKKADDIPATEKPSILSTEINFKSHRFNVHQVTRKDGGYVAKLIDQNNRLYTITVTAENLKSEDYCKIVKGDIILIDGEFYSVDTNYSIAVRKMKNPRLDMKVLKYTE